MQFEVKDKGGMKAWVMDFHKKYITSSNYAKVVFPVRR